MYQKKINIVKEYVIDAAIVNNLLSCRSREVKLNQGYDKFIKFTPLHEEKFMNLLCELSLKTLGTPLNGLFDGIFHVQIAEDSHGDLWFIEASKRLSGTSLVNLAVGFNPVLNIMGIYDDQKAFSNIADTGVWFSYDYLLSKISSTYKLI